MPTIGVYIDWQNAYHGARRAFDLRGLSSEEGQFSPYKLAKRLAAGNDRGDSGELVRVEVHRGLPNSTKDPIGYGANRRHSAAWMRENDALVIPRLRPLRYPEDPTEPPVEKGVDVQLALAAVEHVTSGLCEIAIIFSHDTDLVPAGETICRLRGAAHVETVSWSSGSYSNRMRIRGHNVFHHLLDEDVYEAVADRVNYARRT